MTKNIDNCISADVCLVKTLHFAVYSVKWKKSCPIPTEC